jgi:hypothetical protein
MYLHQQNLILCDPEILVCNKSSKTIEFLLNVKERCGGHAEAGDLFVFPFDVISNKTLGV